MPARHFGRSLADFEPLRDAEKELLKRCRSGEQCVIDSVRPEKPRADGKPPGNTVRAEFLRFLILGGDDATPINKSGLRIQGAWIEGELKLQGTTSTGDFFAFSCCFDKPPNLVDAHIKGEVNLSGSKVPCLKGGRLVCDGGFFADGLVCVGLELWDATIGGDLFARGATLTSDLTSDPTADSLSARRIKVGGNVSLENTFSETVNLSSASIGGRLDFRYAELDAGSRDSISADGIEVGGDVLLAERFRAGGTVRLSSANIRGKLNCTGATLKAPADSEGRAYGVAFEASNIVVKEDVLLNGAFRNSQDMHNLPFTAHGEVNLTGAQIGGNLVCFGATFSGPEYAEGNRGVAFEATNIVVKGNVVLSGVPTYKSDETPADKEMPFISCGTVSLVGATISGNLDCSRAKFTGSEWDLSLDAERLSVSGFFFFGPFEEPVGSVNLQFAHVHILADDEKAWGNRLNLHQFTYDVLANRFTEDVASRLAWLDKQLPELSGKWGDGRQFRPQPWRQLQNAFNEAGYAADAREVAIRFEKRRRHCGQITGVVPRTLHRVYGFATSYGYRLSNRVQPRPPFRVQC